MSTESEVVRKTVSRSLSCVLTKDEKSSYGNALAHEIQRTTQAQETLKSIASEHKAIIQALKEEVMRLSNVINSGYEMRDVDCEVTKNLYLGTIKIIRMDTGEVIEERMLRGDEAQHDFNFE